MRPDWDEYFLGIAEAVAARSDCERSKVGAVVVKDRRIRGTGYNGAPSGQSGCGTCPRRTATDVVAGVSSYDSGTGRCVAIHAEANALLYCDREDLVGATLYITREPCYGCEKLIEAAGIVDVVWPGQKPTTPWWLTDPLKPYRIAWQDNKDGSFLYTEEVSEEEYQRVVRGEGSTPKRDAAWSLTRLHAELNRLWGDRISEWTVFVGDNEDHIIRSEN